MAMREQFSSGVLEWKFSSGRSLSGRSLAERRVAKRAFDEISAPLHFLFVFLDDDAPPTQNGFGEALNFESFVRGEIDVHVVGAGTLRYLSLHQPSFIPLPPTAPFLPHAQLATKT